MRKERRLRRITKLYNEQNGLCYYCNKPADLITGINLHGRQKDNTATVEHIYNRTDIRRMLLQSIGYKNQHIKQIVMAHYKCNNGKSKIDHDLMYINYRNEEAQYDGLLIKLLKDNKC